MNDIHIDEMMKLIIFTYYIQERNWNLIGNSTDFF